MKVLKPLYGVPEAGNRWFKTYHHHHTENLSLKSSTYDPSLLYSDISCDDFGVVGLQTDDTLILANISFAAKEERKLKQAKFLAKDRKMLDFHNPLTFNGSDIHREKNSRTLKLTQERHCKNLKLICHNPIDITSSRGKIRHAILPKDQFIAHRAKGAYIASMCQPESAFDLSSAAQIIQPDDKSIEKLNNRLK